VLLSLIAHRDARRSSGSEALALEKHKVTLRMEMRRNSYDPASGVLLVSDERANAIGVVAAHYRSLYQTGTEETRQLRKDYAFPLRSFLDDHESQALAAFFFWSSWAAVTNRPDGDVSYTSNWPHDPLVGNTPPASLFMWTFILIFLLLAGIGALVWYYARQCDIWRTDMEPIDGYAQHDAPGEHAFHAGERKIFRVGYRFICTAGAPGHHHRPLPRRRAGVIRLAVCRLPALRRYAYLAYAAVRVVDCHSMAGHRAVCRATSVRT
jgi:hypothetical protein